VSREPGRDAALGVYVAVALFMIFTSGFYLYMRYYRRRLKIRSLNPIFMGSIGSAIIILIRAGYNYSGREYLPCGGNLALIYCFWILNLLPDNIQAASFLVKQKFRAQFAEKNLFAHVKHTGAESAKVGPAAVANLHRESSNRGPSSSVTTRASEDINRRCATPGQWFKGFWNHFLTISDTTSFRPTTQITFHSYRFQEDPFVSPVRELSYDFLVRPNDLLSRMCSVN
jgi:hypothetical protein